MKIRLDYVTNSSSSSYIIAYKSTDDEKGKLLEMILSLIIKYTRYETQEGYCVKDKESLDNFMIEEMDIPLDELDRYPETKNDYEKALSYLEKGFTIIFKEVSYNDDDIYNILRELGSEDLVIWEQY